MKKKYPDLDIYLTGGVMIDAAFGEAPENDMRSLIPIMFALLLFLIIISLRSIMATAATLLVIILFDDHWPWTCRLVWDRPDPSFCECANYYFNTCRSRLHPYSCYCLLSDETGYRSSCCYQRIHQSECKACSYYKCQYCNWFYDHEFLRCPALQRSWEYCSTRSYGSPFLFSILYARLYGCSSHTRQKESLKTEQGLYSSCRICYSQADSHLLVHATDDYSDQQRHLKNLSKR